MMTGSGAEAELAALLEDLADRKAAHNRRRAQADAAGAAPPQDWEAVKTALADLLDAHGIDVEDPEALLRQLSAELTDLPRSKPLLSVAAAFGLGFALGRMSK